MIITNVISIFKCLNHIYSIFKNCFFTEVMLELHKIIHSSHQNVQHHCLFICLYGCLHVLFSFLKFYLQAMILLILLFSTNWNLVFLNKPSSQCSQDFIYKYNIKHSFLCMFINAELADKYVKQLKHNEFSFREFIRHSKTFGKKLLKSS